MEKCHEKWQHKQIRKFEDMERNHKAVSTKKKEGTHTYTLWINVTAAIEQVASNMQPNRTSSLRRRQKKKKVRGTKTRQSTLSKRIWVALCLLWDRFLNSSLLGTDVIHQRWQMWHDSSAWEAAVMTDRKLLTAQCVTGKFVKPKTDIQIYWSPALKVPKRGLKD